MPRGGFKNLPKETLSEYGRKGQKKSAEVKRKKRDIRENLKLLSEMPVVDGKIEKLTSKTSVKKALKMNTDSATRIAVALHAKAMTGDIQAIKLWLELTGQNVEEW